jgi:hypothetical protein
MSRHMLNVVSRSVNGLQKISYVIVVKDRTKLKGFKFECTYSYLHIFYMLCVMRVVEKHSRHAELYAYAYARVYSDYYETIFQPYILLSTEYTVQYA